MGEVVSLDDYSSGARRGQAAAPGARMDVFFDRRELGLILDLYGQMVASGDWRDYAIGHDRDVCVFAVYQRSSEAPLYRIVKRPKLARRQGMFQVVGRDGRVLKRGHDLATVLRVFDTKRWKVVE
ncbi:DUF2794 domain-containing protein [Minwuia thermotolerans]|jgi:hypothetical protein|uniref:DUF2794 domain-containing protein n=1 Tax=Minwuia thermotolerans TaxID=2056226 RepID=A0A2M9G0Z0_9PROT|nr:DUF2794 domain-containing protein [Minwuia thermotolerans]PJK29373.1 DUF2794 domain-containing protein [Minwuia thermotolerans]